MRTVYIDPSTFRCSAKNDGNFTVPFDSDFFDDKCDEFVEGFRVIPKGYSWVREDGTVFECEMISLLKPWEEVDIPQRQYERAEAADMKAALALVGVTDE